MSEQQIDISKTPDQYSVLEICNEGIEDRKPGVLCTVKGVFMVANKVNENNRMYTTGLFDKAILGYDYTQKMLEAKTLYGEAAHPEERFDIYIPLVSHNVVALWREGDKLMGKADVLDTPSGRIIDTLVRYGSKIGISARARGQLTTDNNGVIHPDEDMYLFKTFDFVANPGFEEARMSKVNEGVGESITMLQELEKVVESSNVDTLKQIKPIFEYSESLKPLLDKINEKLGSQQKNVDIKESKEYNSMYEDDIYEMYVELDALQSRIDELNSIIAQKDFAINEANRTIANMEHTITVLNENAQNCVEIKNKALSLYDSQNKDFKTKSLLVQSLASQLDEANETITELGSVCEQYEEAIDGLTVELNEAKAENKKLASINESKQPKKVVKVNHTHPVPKTSKPRKLDFLNEGLVSDKQDGVYDLNEREDRQVLSNNKLARFIQGC